MILVDSNAWVYFLDASLPEHEAASVHLEHHLATQEPLIPTIVQLEVMHYVARRMGAHAAEVIETFLQVPGEVEPVTGSVVTEASRILLAHSKEGIGSRDAALLAMAADRGAAILTADKALARVAKRLKIKVLTPPAA